MYITERMIDMKLVNHGTDTIKELDWSEVTFTNEYDLIKEFRKSKDKIGFIYGERYQDAQRG